MSIYMRCVSFCLADSYNLAPIANYFRLSGYNVKQHRKVLRISKSSDELVFVFSYGCIVAWGLTHRKESVFIDQLKQFAINQFKTSKTSYFIYKYSNHTEISTHDRFSVDIISLESNNTRLKLAISYGLAQSIQLESYEEEVRKTIEQNSHYPEQLAKKGRIYLTQKEISCRMGQIVMARSSINLNSDYLVAPEYFWEHPNLENDYDMIKKFLDIPRRVSTLNQKLDVLHELFGMLTSQLQHRHSNILEIIIILLILVEIIISLTSFLKWF